MTLPIKKNLIQYKFGNLKLKNSNTGIIFFVLMTVCGFASAGELSVLVIDNLGQPLENAVVYAEPTSKQPPNMLATLAVEQKGKKFLPLISVVQAGARVTFPNNDTVRHHVYSFSPAKTFELKLYSGVTAAPVLFDKEGTVVLGCNIHDKMIAFIQVVNTPYFGKTDASGKFTFKDLPNAQYALKIWHYALVKENVVAEQFLTIKGSDKQTVKLDINPQALISK